MFWWLYCLKTSPEADPPHDTCMRVDTLVSLPRHTAYPLHLSNLNLSNRDAKLSFGCDGYLPVTSVAVPVCRQNRLAYFSVLASVSY